MANFACWLFSGHGYTADQTMDTELSGVTSLAKDFTLVLGQGGGIELSIARLTTEATRMEGLENQRDENECPLLIK